MIRLAAILACLAGPAAAQQACASRAAVIQSLGAGYGEVHQSEGVDKLGNAIEVWTNNKTDTFTILSTQPNGVTCFVTSGIGWQTKPLGDPA